MGASPTKRILSSRKEAREERSRTVDTNGSGGFVDQLQETGGHNPSGAVLLSPPYLGLHFTCGERVAVDVALDAG